MNSVICRLYKCLQAGDMLPHPDLNHEILTSSDRNMARSGIEKMLYRNNQKYHQDQPQGRTQQGGGGVVVIGHKYKPQQQQGQGSPHVVGSKYRPGSQGGYGSSAGGGCSRCGGGSSIVEARSNSGSGGFVVVGSSRKRRNQQSFDAGSSRSRALQEQALWSRFSREELRRRSNLLRLMGRKIPF